jgi:nitroreductase
VLLVACVAAPGSAVLPDASQASMWGSLFPAVWSYMLAARARGLGTVWTDLHLRYEQEVAGKPGIRNPRLAATTPVSSA